jgi:hypothetical protein
MIMSMHAYVMIYRKYEVAVTVFIVIPVTVGDSSLIFIILM